MRPDSCFAAKLELKLRRIPPIGCFDAGRNQVGSPLNLLYCRKHVGVGRTYNSNIESAFNSTKDDVECKLNIDSFFDPPIVSMAKWTSDDSHSVVRPTRMLALNRVVSRSTQSRRSAIHAYLTQQPLIGKRGWSRFGTQCLDGTPDAHRDRKSVGRRTATRAESCRLRIKKIPVLLCATPDDGVLNCAG